MRDTGLTMSNFDHDVPEGMESALKAEPSKASGDHTAWGHYGKVWFDDGKFCEEVFVYGSSREIIKADSLEDLMSAVNDEYGYE